ncbi:hypothetical protein [Sphingomonas sp.]|uniref:hypothetical protein n=1 Tax=Sphingomonas sp. TaxID=28214 RepID=UPI0025DAEB6E|nr:hypothetical protein [Sphingomonas sp.]
MVSTAFAAVVGALATVVEQRPITGLHVGKVGDWTITLNASREPVMHLGKELPMWTAEVTNDRYLVVAMLDPTGGIVGGMPEDQFIAEMEAFA